jgi:pyruvate,water dikinase
MTLTQVWGALLIFILCPLLGGLPLIAWLTRLLTGQDLAQIGTGNISVSAAFYHGGRWVGVLAVLSEALKGIATVLLARSFFPTDPAWEVIALIALVMGRYWIAQGAGTTNVVWGYVVHDPVVAGLVFVVSGIGFTLLRERGRGRYSVLVLFPLITALRHPQALGQIGAAIALAVLLGWIYTKIADDLDLDPQTAQTGSQTMFRFFRGDRAIRSLDQNLDRSQVGNKAATLAELKRLSYPVLPGWVLLPGEDPAPLIASLKPSPASPLIVRSSAVGEDSEVASAAGQYKSILNVTDRPALQTAILHCFESYDAPTAVQYRRDRQLPDATIAVLIQPQVAGVFSGVAFSRDPIAQQGTAVVIEAVPGDATQVVSGRVTPESYRVLIQDADIPQLASENPPWTLPEAVSFPIDGSGNLPPRLLQQIALLTRQLEVHFQGVPQDIEWSYDGESLWLLQSRPIPTLLPIWTRKIAAEVIPGVIRPLTWSVNRPLTCGVWGQIFTLVLGDRAQGLNFNETATLHFSRAYFNATLLGKIFLRMGLPPESLEFLIRGAKFSKPPLRATLQALPGLFRLAQREWSLWQDFQRDEQQQFAPILTELARVPAPDLSPTELLKRIEFILDRLQTATYYSILAPLSAALRQKLFRVQDSQLDMQSAPEVAAVRSLQSLATAARQVLTTHALTPDLIDWSGLTAALAQLPEGQRILQQFEQLLDRYGYLSEVGTDIAVPTWREEPHTVQDLFVQFCQHPSDLPALSDPISPTQSVQRRFTLKGRVTEVYSRLLAELRWSFLALEAQWLAAGWLQTTGDIFFLELEEIRQLIQTGSSAPEQLQSRIAQRRTQHEVDRQLAAPPFLVYGNLPPRLVPTTTSQPVSRLRGIGASPGQIEGQVQVIQTLTNLPPIDRATILVVPYTDSGWAPLLARAGGLIAEVGGRLSHGAIVAREYRIPAVMDIPNATQILQSGQRVRLDGQQGTIDLL